MDGTHSLSLRALASGVVAVTLVACSASSATQAAFGEVLIEIDTNLAPPKTLSRVRIDVFDAKQHWLETRDVATISPADFPLSFSVYTESTDQVGAAFVRVRGYREGNQRDYLGERFRERAVFEEPWTAQSLEQACDEAPLLAPGFADTLRLRGAEFPGVQLECERQKPGSGLAVFAVFIPVDGEYRVAVTSAEPGLAWSNVADTLLSLRSDCKDASSQLACNNDEHPEFSTLSGLTKQLAAGDYYALIGNVAHGPMDVTLLVSGSDAAGTEPADSTPSDQPGPRLMADGVDVTPATEPEPGLAVDRLVRVEIEPGQQHTAKVLLDGACLGTMADLLGQRSCVDQEGVLVDLDPEPLLDGRLGALVSAAGTWAGYEARGCAPSAAREHPSLFDARVCVTGGAFVLGDKSVIARGADAGQPERMALIPPFYMDRYEYSVARYRAARARGFEPSDAGPQNSPLGVALDPEDIYRACTWNELANGSAPFPKQDALPLSCVTWLTARALCQLDGGDLPSVAQREFAASAAGRDLETTYPWGELSPDCEGSVFGGWPDPFRGSSECLGSRPRVGPVAVDAEPWASNDRTPQGIVQLGGNLAEWTRDSHRAYADDCWQSQGLESPICLEGEAPLHTIAGGSWRSPAGGTRAAVRTGGAVAGVDPWVGFRCVYPGTKP